MARHQRRTTACCRSAGVSQHPELYRLPSAYLPAQHVQESLEWLVWECPVDTGSCWLGPGISRSKSATS
jgi:hypothetical protein